MRFHNLHTAYKKTKENMCFTAYALVSLVLVLLGLLAGLLWRYHSGKNMTAASFGSPAHPLIQRCVLVKRSCRRSMHIHINEMKSMKKKGEKK